MFSVRIAIFVACFLAVGPATTVTAAPVTNVISAQYNEALQQQTFVVPEQPVRDADLSETTAQDVEPSTRLIRTSEEGDAEWLTEEEINQLRLEKIRFVDVTDWEGPNSAQVAAPVVTYNYPEAPKHQDEVEPLLEEVSPTGMQFFLEEFSTLHRTRYYKSKSGAQASAYLQKQIRLIVNESLQTLAAPSNVSIRVFDHKWAQSSIIARFEPDHEVGEDEPIVIIGAHLDSVNQWLPSFGRSPGADDDGSGTTTILEAFRILVESGFVPARPVEFHWYSAEEAGLLGSADVSRDYAKDKKNVVGMVQFDMTGYHKPGTKEQIGVMTDNVDPQLTSFLKTLIDEYAGLPYVETSCGYGCSDHASWKKAGYASTFPFEGEFKDTSPYIHSTEDTVENVSFDHMAAFVKLALGYAVELGQSKD